MLLTGEAVQEVNETIQYLCKEIHISVEKSTSNGARVTDINNLPELVQSIANLVQSIKN